MNLQLQSTVRSLATRLLSGRDRLFRRRFRLFYRDEELDDAGLLRLTRRLSPNQLSQLGEVFARIEALGNSSRLNLSVEACLTRFIPASSMASNLALLDAKRHAERQERIDKIKIDARERYQLSPTAIPQTVPEFAPALIECVTRARRISWILGAGISVAAGIPTYRGKTSSGHDPMDKLLTLPAYLANPDLVWAMVNVFRGVISQKEPTAAHQAIANFNTRTERNVAITQNVDGLGFKAGIESINVHGRLHEYKCLNEEAYKVARDPRYNGASFPICPDCGSLLKPGVVFFFEGLNAQRFDDSLDALAQSDVVFEVGTSHTVYPVSKFGRYAKMKGATLIIINPWPGPSVSYADHVLAADAQVVLPALWQRICSI